MTHVYLTTRHHLLLVAVIITSQYPRWIVILTCTVHSRDNMTVFLISFHSQSDSTKLFLMSGWPNKRFWFATIFMVYVYQRSLNRLYIINTRYFPKIVFDKWLLPNQTVTWKQKFSNHRCEAIRFGEILTLFEANTQASQSTLKNTYPPLLFYCFQIYFFIS